MSAQRTKPEKPKGRSSDWQAGFLAMMPAIINHARFSFRRLDSEARREAIQEVLVSSVFAYVRLFERGKVDLAYPSVLTRFAVAQYRAGRRVATKLNRRDVLSEYARRTRSIQVQSIDAGDMDNECWREALVEDKHAGPADTAAVRIDFAGWLDSLSRRDRRIADALSDGSATGEIAKRFCISSGRISQKRRQFLESWRKFHGDQDTSRSCRRKTQIRAGTGRCGKD